MKYGIVLGFVLVLAGVAQAREQRFRIVDGDSGAPIAGARIQRRASQWQPCTIPWMPPDHFWFPAERVTSDREGFASLEKVARDDRYDIRAEGYEEETLARGWFKVRSLTRPKGSPPDVVEQSGTLVIRLRPSSAKAMNRLPD